MRKKLSKYNEIKTNKPSWSLKMLQTTCFIWAQCQAVKNKLDLNRNQCAPQTHSIYIFLSQQPQLSSGFRTCNGESTNIPTMQTTTLKLHLLDVVGHFVRGDGTLPRYLHWTCVNTHRNQFQNRHVKHEKPLCTMSLTACPNSVSIQTFLTEQLRCTTGAVKPKRQVYCIWFPQSVGAFGMA